MLALVVGQKGGMGSVAVKIGNHAPECILAPQRV